jgi:signal transduction histidine kinase
VLINLILNALKFTKEGSLSINSRIEDKEREEEKGEEEKK